MTAAIQSWKACIKTAIRGIFFRPGWYRSNYGGLERMYRVLHDPWNFESSPYERDRMDVLEAFVHRYPHRSILEIGCAEGVFTSRLYTLCDELVALDVSPTAIERARERCPGATLFQVGIEQFEAEKKFDLVICSETLYYMKDVGRVLEKISRMGRYCLVSYLTRESKTLDRYVGNLPLLEFKTFEKYYGVVKYSMNVAVWRNAVANVETQNR